MDSGDAARRKMIAAGIDQALAYAARLVMLEDFDSILAYAQRERKRKLNGQGSLFEEEDDGYASQTKALENKIEQRALQLLQESVGFQQLLKPKRREIEVPITPEEDQAWWKYQWKMARAGK